MATVRALGPVLLMLAATASGFGATMVLADPASQEAAKKDAQAFAKGLIPTVKQDAQTQPTADSVPNYTSDPSQESYYKDEDALKADSRAQSSSNEGYQSVRQSMDQRATIPQSDLDDTLKRSFAIQDDASPYVSGFSASGTNGSCKQLPAGSGSAGTYEQACNSGVSGTGPVEKVCNIKLGVSFEVHDAYEYYLGEKANFWIHSSVEPEVQAALSSGVCKQTGDASYCGIMPQYGLKPSSDCKQSYDPIHTYVCTQELTFSKKVTEKVLATGAYWYGKTETKIPVTARDDSGCASVASNSECTLQGSETCTDSLPTTRDFDGTPVTASCWGWTRTYQCMETVPINDCSDLTNQGCTFERQECLTDETPCKTFEDVYLCPIPATDTDKQYICDGDVYCINGDCETIDRTPNTEFGNAVMALNSAAQAGKELNPDTLTIFDGTRETCDKTLLGITNCCAPRGVPIIGVGCSKEDKALKEKRDKGLCHYVGSYCSSKVLGVCLKKKEAHCCFVSKLSRIIQEQGRPQLGLGWGKPKNATCEGFTIDQFSHLDLSKMDFSEVMAEFEDAAKLPDDLQTANELQSKIKDYYASHTN
ncbi:conjugal transfer protein TraN [Sphingomonas oryzagri]